MNENEMPIFDPNNPNYNINNYEPNVKYIGETQQIEKNISENNYYKNDFINSTFLNEIEISTDVKESQSIDINNGNNEKNNEINNNNDNLILNKINSISTNNNFSLLKNNNINNNNKSFNHNINNITRNKRKNKSKKYSQKISNNKLKSQRFKNFIKKSKEDQMKFIKEETDNEKEDEDEDDVVSEDEEKINLNNIFNKNNNDYLNKNIFNQNCITKKNNFFMDNYIKSISGFEKINIVDNNEIEMNIKIIKVFDFNLDNEICKFSYNDNKKEGIIFVKKPIDDKIKTFLIKYLNNQQMIKIKLEKYEIKNNNNNNKNMNFEYFLLQEKNFKFLLNEIKE